MTIIPEVLFHLMLVMFQLCFTLIVSTESRTESLEVVQNHYKSSTESAQDRYDGNTQLAQYHIKARPNNCRISKGTLQKQYIKNCFKGCTEPLQS